MQLLKRRELGLLEQGWLALLQREHFNLAFITTGMKLIQRRAYGLNQPYLEGVNMSEFPFILRHIFDTEESFFLRIQQKSFIIIGGP